MTTPSTTGAAASERVNGSGFVKLPGTVERALSAYRKAQWDYGKACAAGGDGDMPDAVAEWQALRRSIAALDGCARQPIATAPLNREVYVYCGEMRFRAKLVPNGSMYEAEDGKERYCDLWQATRDGEHSPCWSEGGCWASNADENASIQPTHWSPAEVTPTPEA